MNNVNFRHVFVLMVMGKFSPPVESSLKAEKTDFGIANVLLLNEASEWPPDPEWPPPDP